MTAPDYAKLAASLDLAEPMTGGARTPGVVDAIEWLGMPEAQACREVGCPPEMYAVAARGVAKVCALWLNRTAQGIDAGPRPTIGRRLTAATAPLLSGGRVHRIGKRSRKRGEGATGA
jgi:hypothetical protein